MAGDNEVRPDAVAELVRALREQAARHVDHIADLERRLIAANQRIADQQRLLARLLEKGDGARPPASLPAELARAIQPPAPELPSKLPSELPPARIRESERPFVAEAAPVAVLARPAEPAPPEGAPEALPPAAIPPVSAPMVIPSADAGARIQLPRAEASLPRLDSIAGAVLLARDARSGRGDSAPALPVTPVQPDSEAPTFEPTAGIVRAAGVETSAEERETTLTLDREELARGHRAMQDGRRWFPFGRR
jgi:hypothetical protein